jgi:SAM-dependent methyltransferase
MKSIENYQESDSPESSYWAEYYAATADRPVNALLVESLKHISREGTILDLGAGSGADAKYLSEQGYFVTAVDSDPAATQYFQDNQDNRIVFIQSGFIEYDFPKDEFILVSAQYALPFICDKEQLVEVVHRVKGSLKKDGVFAGQFFGDQSKWPGDNTPPACLTREEIESLFSDMNMIKFHEQIQDGKTATGKEKYWQVFHVIAQKK